MIQVNSSRKYNITVADSWNELRKAVDEVAKGKKIAIITDSNVEKLYLEEVKNILSGYKVVSFSVVAGESSKCMTEYERILEFLAENAFRRDDMVLALGGGVVGDLAGFVASTYMRGIVYFAVPTTLLAMIDSSVGGKTAINLSVGKNLCGTFYQPFAVYANINTLKTLPEKEILCGKGELAKYAILDKRITLDDIENFDSITTITKCITIKKEIVEADEFESGKRMLLNLGHTFGHAIEGLSNYSIPHGICVLQGIYVVAKISQKMFDFGSEYDEIIKILQKVSLEEPSVYSIEDILYAISVDKKSNKNGINLVVIEKIGECKTVNLSMDKLRSFLN